MIHFPQLTTPQQPEGEELVVDKISIAFLGDEVLVKKCFDGRHHAAGRAGIAKKL